MFDRKFLLAILVVLCGAMVFSSDLSIAGVNYEPAPATPGGALNLWVHLQNDSIVAAENVVFRLDLENSIGGGKYPFSLDSGETAEKTISTINAKQSVLLEYRLKVDSEALNGVYTIKMLYGEGGKTIKGNDYTITVFNRKPEIEVIDSSPVEASPGKTVDFEVKIKNIGYDSAKRILVEVGEDRTVTATGVVVERVFSAAGSSVIYAEDLEAGKEATIRFKLAVNPESALKSYTIPIKITYWDTNFTEYSTERHLGIIVKEDAQIDAVISSAEPTPYAGGNPEIVFDIFNIGSGKAKYVVAELSAENIVFENKKLFIGTLEPDDFDSFKVKAKIAEGATGSEIPVKLKLTYKTAYSEPREIEKTLILSLHPKEEAAIGQGIDPWFIAVALIAIYWVGRKAYNRFRKK